MIFTRVVSPYVGAKPGNDSLEALALHKKCVQSGFDNQLVQRPVRPGAAVCQSSAPHRLVQKEEAAEDRLELKTIGLSVTCVGHTSPNILPAFVFSLQKGETTAVVPSLTCVSSGQTTGPDVKWRLL